MIATRSRDSAGLDEHLLSTRASAIQTLNKLTELIRFPNRMVVRHPNTRLRFPKKFDRSGRNRERNNREFPIKLFRMNSF